MTCERGPLGASERTRLGRLIDSAVRQRIRWGDQCRCVSCGVEIRDPDSGTYRYAVGCRTCADRRCKHRQRE